MWRRAIAEHGSALQGALRQVAFFAESAGPRGCSRLLAGKFTTDKSAIICGMEAGDVHDAWQVLSEVRDSPFFDNCLLYLRLPVGKCQGGPITGTCEALARAERGPCDRAAQGRIEANQWLCLLRGSRRHAISCRVAPRLFAGHEGRRPHRGAGRTIGCRDGVRNCRIIRRRAWRRPAPFESCRDHPAGLYGPNHDDSLGTSGRGPATTRRPPHSTANGSVRSS